MKSTQPCDFACIGIVPFLPADLCSRDFRLLLVESRRKPMPCGPAMADGDDSILIPLKLRDLRFSQADGNQPEGRHPLEREFMQQARSVASTVYLFFDTT